MRSIIFYSSYYRTNTEKVAQAMASEIKGEFKNTKQLKDVDYDVSSYDLIGFGSGVYREDLSPQIYRLLEHLELKEKKVFVFSTSGIGMTFYNKRLFRHLKEKGALPVGSFACKGSFTASDFSKNRIFHMLGKSAEGHPNHRDLSNARKFILKVIHYTRNL
ncbi:flavodoxin family protein [Proteiniclasticum sp. C24MP]|uniref:flavodoxin family protein n=1 Tax=Proteiniclasticum sp. C24MP TaxID=3374101 RepID=UPI0037551D6F